MNELRTLHSHVPQDGTRLRRSQDLFPIHRSSAVVTTTVGKFLVSIAAMRFAARGRAV